MLNVYAPGRHYYADDTVCCSNPGGSDAAAVVAWQVALNQTDNFSGLLDHYLMSMDSDATTHLLWNVLS